jgi:hypothetical protein
MSKNNIRQQKPSFQHFQYYFIAAAIAGIVHLYIPLGFPKVLGNPAIATFFLGSGIAQIFWPPYFSSSTLEPQLQQQQQTRLFDICKETIHQWLKIFIYQFIKALIFRFPKLLLCIDYLGEQHYFGKSRNKLVDPTSSMEGVDLLKKGKLDDIINSKILCLYRN